MCRASILIYLGTPFADRLMQGGVLIFIAARALAWTPVQRRANYIIPCLQVILGIALGLLGLLDIGSRRVTLDDGQGLNHHLNPLYLLLQQRLPLFVVLGGYALTLCGQLVTARITRRKMQTGNAA